MALLMNFHLQNGEPQSRDIQSFWAPVAKAFLLEGVAQRGQKTILPVVRFRSGNKIPGGLA